MLRLSGARAFAVAARLAGPLPPPRRAALRAFRDAEGRQLDRGLVLCFPGPASYTGEDLVELQGHGSPALMQLLLEAACAAGARLAQAGEFTQRAFLNERLDLAQAEAVADLIEASHRGAVLAANRSLEGAFSQRVQALVEDLIGLRVDVEAALDFSDEDVDWLGDVALQRRLQRLDADLAALLAGARQGRRLREGLVVAIAGAPNVGKSTLLNRLAGSDVAIVADVPGTTRDLLREQILLDGLPLTVIDTAGLRQSDDPVEREGIRRARDALSRAEAILYLLDDRQGTGPDDLAELARLPPAVPRLLLHNKCDLSRAEPAQWQDDIGRHLRISARSGAGLDGLTAELHAIAGLGPSHEGVFSARARHVEALKAAAAHLTAARAHLTTGAAAELAAEELRLSQERLAEITGRFGADDLLGRIFSSFCIGK